MGEYSLRFLVSDSPMFMLYGHNLEHQSINWTLENMIRSQYPYDNCLALSTLTWDTARLFSQIKFQIYTSVYESTKTQRRKD